MSACHNVRQVFRYVFYPFGKQKRDGGFSVHLYSDGTFCFRAYTSAGFVAHEETFVVSSDVIAAYARLAVDNRGWLIRKMPVLAHHSKHLAACIIEIGDYAPIYAIDLEELTSLPESDPVGFFAKRIWVLFENASSLLLWCGLYLFQDHFSSMIMKPVVLCDGTEERDPD